jgi:hypothetical protein
MVLSDDDFTAHRATAIIDDVDDSGHVETVPFPPNRWHLASVHDDEEEPFRLWNVTEDHTCVGFFNRSVILSQWQTFGICDTLHKPPTLERGKQNLSLGSPQSPQWCCLICRIHSRWPNACHC